MQDGAEIIDVLASAIRDRRRVRLAYSRQADGVVSLHEVAPVDMRPGWSERTKNIPYLWAWCFAESKLEMHLLDRIKRVELLDLAFSPQEVLASWPAAGWPKPDEWNVPRDWS